jgi:hypothetical protein
MVLSSLSKKLLPLIVVACAIVFPSRTDCFSFGALKARGRSSGNRLFRFFRRESSLKKPTLPEQQQNINSLKIQPKPARVETKLQQKYAAIDDVEERAFQVLLDLGLIGDRTE